MENYLKKELYELIKKDEKIFDFIQESSLDGLWYWDLEKPENEWMNARFWTTLGYNPEEMPHLASAWQSIINKDDLKIAIDNVQKHLNDSSHPYDQIVRYIHKNGSTVWIRCRGIAIRDESGKPIRMLGAHHDITDLKKIEIDLIKSKEYIEKDNVYRLKTEKALIHSRDLMRYIIEHNRSAVAVHDRDLKYIYVSQRYLHDYNVKEKDVIGMHHYDVFPDLPQKWRDVHQKALQGIVSSAEDDPYVRDDGSTEWTRWECRPWYEADGAIGGIIVYTEVITERKKLENELVHKNMELEASEEEIRSANEELYNAYEILKSTNAELESEKLKAEENAQHLMLLIEHAPEAIFIQTELQFAYLNKLAVSLFGAVNESEIIGKNVIEFIHPDSQQKAINQIITFSDNSENQEFLIVNLKGVTLFAEISSVPFVHNGKKGSLVFVRDITERKQYEVKLKNSYNLLNNIAERVPGVVYQYRLYPDGRSAFPYSSQGMYEIYEVTSEEVRYDASPVFTRLHPDDFDMVVKLINESARNQTMFQCEFKVLLPKQGLRWRQSYAKPQLMEDGSTLWHGIITDITERKLAEEKLREQQLLFETMFNTISDGVVITNKEHNVILANKGMQTTFGYKPENLNGKPTCFLLEDNDNQHDNSSAVDPANSPETFIAKYKNSEGLVFPGETFGSKLFDSKGEWIGNLTIIRNISDRLKYIEELQIARKKAEESDQLKTAFLHNISHEIRTPMNAIMGFSEFLNNPELSIEKRRKFTDLIIQSSKQLLSIITDIVNIATIEAGQAKVELIETVVNNTLQLLYQQYKLKAQGKDITISYEAPLSGQEAIIYTDGTKLTEVLSNLVGNALKFTPRGHVKFGYTLKADYLEFFVEDSGIGIPKELHNEIFLRFRQVESSMSRQFGGSGLGLSISKAYLELLGGKIWVESELGKGATFYFTIPYKRVYHLNFTKLESPESIDVQLKQVYTLLIAEDNDSNYLFLEELLNRKDIKIIRAYNGIEAVEYCEHNEQIDLVLMDMKMPLMDGFEATRKIKTLCPQLPIIAQTAYSIEADIKKAFDCGCSDILSKPINGELLLEKIKYHLFSK